MKLHFYVARRFLFTFILVGIALSGVFIMLDSVEHLRRFGARLGMLEITQLTLMNMPGVMYQILPLIIIISAVFMFLAFSRSSEMVVTRAAGRPALLTLLAPATVAFLIGVMALTLLNPIAAATSKEYKRLITSHGGHAPSVISLSSEGFWLRQGDEGSQTVIRASSTGPDGGQLYGVSFFSFSTDGKPLSRINAAEARLEEGRWALSDAKIWDLTDLSNPERQAVETKAFWVATNLTLDGIKDNFAKPSSIPIWEMPAFIEELKQAGFSPRRHMVWFQSELASPLFMVAMLLIGAAFTMRHTRLGQTGMMALMALMLGFGIYFIRNFATILGENGQIPIMVAAWTPPIAGLLLALGLILHLEDG